MENLIFCAVRLLQNTGGKDHVYLKLYVNVYVRIVFWRATASELEKSLPGARKKQVTMKAGWWS